MPKYKKLLSLLEFSYHNSTYSLQPTPEPDHWAPVMSELYIINAEVRNKYDAFYQKFKDNKLKNNTSIHLSSLSILPSYKLKSYLKDNKLNIKTVRKNSKPDDIIVSDEYIRDLYIKDSDKLYYIIPADYLKSISKGKKNKEEFDDADFYVYSFDNNRRFYGEEDNHKDIVMQKYPSIYAKLQTFNTFYGECINSSWGNKNAFENYNYFINLINNIDNINVVFDAAINNEINNGLIIDEDLLANLINMLKSTDKSNLTLAQEIVANCELESSKPYILFLLWKFENFRRINNNKNFKYCLDSLKAYKKLYGTSYNRVTLEDFMSNVIKDHPEYKQAVFNCLKIYINNESNKDIINNIIIS